MKKKNAVIFDIDGTLALFNDKDPYDRDFTQDDINIPVQHVLRMYHADLRYIIIVSGRKDIYKKQTILWLKKHNIPYDFLYMRPTQPKGIQEPSDVIVKQQIYDTYIKDQYNILGVFDDRKKVKKMWVENGLFVFDVNQTDAEY